MMCIYQSDKRINFFKVILLAKRRYTTVWQYFKLEILNCSNGALDTNVFPGLTKYTSHPQNKTNVSLKILIFFIAAKNLHISCSFQCKSNISIAQIVLV